MSGGGPFRLGINYWPARTAMRWWPAFDAGEAAADFDRIASYGFDGIRLFLRWEDFQPTASHVDSTMVGRLVIALDLAREAGLSVMPTLFTGHMSGVNWIPGWALERDAGDGRFRVVSGGRVVAARPVTWYADETMARAQALLAHQVAGAVAGHEALWAWDLGNENSNCSIPPDTAHAREWLLRITHAIRGADAHALVTIGLHLEDLEEDRHLGPHEAAEACDFLTMHGYPGYAAWAGGPADARMLPFLARLTRWLGGGADVLFAEFGVPTAGRDEAERRAAGVLGHALLDEQAAAAYVDQALAALVESGSTGAMLWCYTDYAEGIWGLPPLDRAVHERSFGLWRADGTPKPALAGVSAFAARRIRATGEPLLPDAAWIDIEPHDYYRAPGWELPRLYGRYCRALEAAGEAGRVTEPR